jgi:multidrug efflux pump subunit AcrA (membrane-fusion protein)
MKVRKTINVDNAVWYELKLEAFQKEVSLGDHLQAIFENRNVAPTQKTAVEIPLISTSHDLTGANLDKEMTRQFQNAANGVGANAASEGSLSSLSMSELNTQIKAGEAEKVVESQEDEMEFLKKKNAELFKKRETNQAELDASRKGRDIKKDKIAKLKEAGVFNPQPKKEKKK